MSNSIPKIKYLIFVLDFLLLEVVINPFLVLGFEVERKGDQWNCVCEKRVLNQISEDKFSWVWEFWKEKVLVGVLHHLINNSQVENGDYDWVQENEHVIFVDDWRFSLGFQVALLKSFWKDVDDPWNEKIRD